MASLKVEDTTPEPRHGAGNIADLREIIAKKTARCGAVVVGERWISAGD